MEYVLPAVAAFAALATPLAARAADLSVRAPTSPFEVPAQMDWSGFYAGGLVGYGWQPVDTNIFNGNGELVATSPSLRRGVFGGAEGGFNWMPRRNWLVGLESDVSTAELKATTFSCFSTGCGLSNGETVDLATVRGRVGYAWNNLLFYGTGGWAWSRGWTKQTITCVTAGGGICPGGPSPAPLTGMSAFAIGNQGGWAVGAGVEWSFARQWSFKVEYMHLQFDSVVRDLNYAAFPTASRHTVSDLSTDTVRVGINYLFNVAR